jgi:hypothetical protein
MWRNIFGALLRQEVIMADLPTNERNALADKVFGLPEKRAYPMPDANHARNAKARAAEELKRGNLSSAERDRVDRKADEILAQR